MTGTAVQLPFRRGTAKALGPRLYRKQILPRGATINYKGRSIAFDDPFLTDLAAAFQAGAYDQVSFLLAPPDNSHTMDPERFRGEVKGLEFADDGLYGILALSEEGAKVVEANPNLGVSARIVEGLEHADGRYFPRALQHVLGTLDPRVTGMKPWEPLNLSSSGPFVDLTAATFDNEEEPTMGDTDTTLTDADRAKFDAYLTDLAKLAPDANAGGAGGDGGTGDIDPAFEAELERLIAEEEAALVGAGAGTGEGDTSLSAEHLAAIELARTQAQATREELAGVQAELAQARFEREAAELTSAGVPPAMIELAKPLLVAPSVIELSNGSSIDAGDIVRRLLGEAKGTIDLSGPTPGAVAHPADDAEAAVLEEWERQFPAKR